MTTLAGIELPDDLAWTDEFRWTPYAESAEHALDGALIVETSPAAQAGRPITLEGGRDRAWIGHDKLESLRTLLGEQSMALELWDGRQFTVGWRHADRPLEATEYIGSGWWHSLTLRLREL